MNIYKYGNNTKGKKYDPNRAFIDPRDARDVWLKYETEEDYSTYIKFPIWITDGVEVELDHTLYKEVPRSVEMSNGNYSEYWMAPGHEYPWYNDEENRELTEHELIKPPIPKAIYTCYRINHDPKEHIPDAEAIKSENLIWTKKIQRLKKLKEMIIRENVAPWQSARDYNDLIDEMDEYIELLHERIKII